MRRTGIVMAEEHSVTYRIIIDESLHMTKYQWSQVAKTLRTCGAMVVDRQPTIRFRRTDSKFHGEVRAVFRDVEHALQALQQIGTLKLGGWFHMWQLVDESGTVVLLSPDEIAAINKPLTGQSAAVKGRDNETISRRELWHTLMERQNYQCYVCGLTWEEQDEVHNQSFDIHRVLPGHSGGQYTLANTVMVCRPCHEQVQDLNLVETNRIREQLRG